MNFTYILFLITFLAYPIATVIASHFFEINQRISKIVRVMFICFAVHNIFFFLGWSIRGNYIDYIIFSLEYLLLCFVLFLVRAKVNKYLSIFRFLSLFAVSLGVLIGILGIFLFPILSQDYEPSRIFLFNDNNDAFYETRGYTVGAAFTANTRYTFETYRIFKYLPIEKKLDKTDLFEFNTPIEMEDPKLHIQIKTLNGHDQIQFWSGSSFIYRKPLN